MSIDTEMFTHEELMKKSNHSLLCTSLCMQQCILREARITNQELKKLNQHKEREIVSEISDRVHMHAFGSSKATTIDDLYRVGEIVWKNSLEACHVDVTIKDNILTGKHLKDMIRSATRDAYTSVIMSDNIKISWPFQLYIQYKLCNGQSFVKLNEPDCEAYCNKFKDIEKKISALKSDNIKCVRYGFYFKTKTDYSCNV